MHRRSLPRAPHDWTIATPTVSIHVGYALGTVQALFAREYLERSLSDRGCRMSTLDELDVYGRHLPVKTVRAEDALLLSDYLVRIGVSHRKAKPVDIVDDDLETPGKSIHMN